MRPIAKEKVISNPVREPINLQAALIMRRCPDWALPTETFEQSELRRLRTENATMKNQLLVKAQELRNVQNALDKTKKQFQEASERLKQCVVEQERKVTELEGTELEAAKRKLARLKTITAFCVHSGQIRYNVNAGFEKAP